HRVRRVISMNLLAPLDIETSKDLNRGRQPQVGIARMVPVDPRPVGGRDAQIRVLVEDDAIVSLASIDHLLNVCVAQHVTAEDHDGFPRGYAIRAEQARPSICDGETCSRGSSHDSAGTFMDRMLPG